MAKKAKLKLKKLEDLVDLDQLCIEYSLPEQDMVEKVNFYIDEELGYEPDIEDDLLHELVMRSLRLELKAHKISKAVTTTFYLFGKSQAYDYVNKRRERLTKLFDIDPKKAVEDGDGDAKCDENGEIVYKHQFKTGAYPEHGYRYEALLLGKIQENGKELKDLDYKILSYSGFEENELEIYNQLKVGKWYTTKLIVGEQKEKDFVVSVSPSKLTEWKPIKSIEKLNWVDISYDKTKKKPKQEGLLYSNLFGMNIIRLKDRERFFKKFHDGSFMPPERFVALIADVVSISDDGRNIRITDDSLDPEDLPATCWDNREDKTFIFGPRSKILIFGSMKYNSNNKDYDINASSIMKISRDKGGYFYPSQIAPITKIEKVKAPTAMKAKSTKKTPKKEKDGAPFPNLMVSKEFISEEIQNEIVSSLHALDGSATFDDILEKTELKEDEEYQSSFQDLIDRKIFIRNEEGEFEI